MKKITLLMVCLFTTIITNAQWTSNTAVNTLVDPTNAIDTQSLVNSQGETVIVYWKNLGTGDAFDLNLYIQKLDAAGNKLLGEDGKLISNTIPMNSFVQQWSLTLDANDNVYVGVTGTNGNIGIAFKLNSNGDNQWTNDGINLGTAYLVKVLPLASGNAIVTWLNGSTFEGNIQKYDASGNAVWTNATSLGSGNVPANSFELSDGGFVNLYHNLLSGVTSKMFAQRYNSDGVPQWSNATQLFEDGNNTTYNTPYSGLQDGDVIYISYKLAHDSRFDSHVQRINPDGSLPWGITGMDFDTNETNYEQETQIAMAPGAQEIYALCRYTDATQSQSGIYLQKFDKDTGARLLSDNAKEIYTIGSDASLSGKFQLVNGQPVFLTLASNHSLSVNLLDASGDFVWAEESKPIATYSNYKTFISLNQISDSELVITFKEDKGTGEKVYAQNFTDTALSVNEFSTNSTLQFFNPIQNELKLKSNQTITSVEIYNALGQLISTIKNNNSNELNINSQNWNSGMYLVVVTNNNKKQSIKIIKK